MRNLMFNVPGAPVPQSRPRIVLRGKNVIAYTPQKTKDYQTLVAECAYTARISKWGDLELIKSFVQVDISLYFLPPKSMSKALTRKALNKEIFPGGGRNYGDVDNFAKCILDGLNNVIWKDDLQVVDLRVRKYFGEIPGAWVYIKEVANNE